jgi:hypothetical protein
VLTLTGFFDPFAWRANRVYFSGQIQGWDVVRAGEVTIDPRTWQAVGEPRRLTAGTTHEDSPSLSTDGHRLVFASLAKNPSLYELPIEANRGKAAGAPQRLTSDDAENFAQSISADGKRIVFVSNRTGSDPKRLLATRRCTLYEKGRSDGFPRGTLSVRSNSSNGSSALQPDYRSHGFHRISALLASLRQIQMAPSEQLGSRFIHRSSPYQTALRAVCDRTGGVRKRALYL